MSAAIQIIGAYRIELTRELLTQAMDAKYEGVDLSDNERQQAEEAVIEELSNVVLVEVRISGRDERFDVGDFGQKGSDQSPYDEHFLSEDGTCVVADGFDVPPGETLRCTFFLHFFDSTRPLATSYGEVAVPFIQPVPERLRELIPYEPVD